MIDPGGSEAKAGSSESDLDEGGGPADALDTLRSDGGGGIWRATRGVLRTEWKYLLIGVMILVGHFKYHLSLLYYAHELAHAQEEHVLADNQRQANDKTLQHHVDLGNSLFGDGEMRGAESEFKEALKLDGTNLDAQRGLFKASIFSEVDDDTNQRTASPVVIFSRIHELACEVRETACLDEARHTASEESRAERAKACTTARGLCIKQPQGSVTLTGIEGAHARLLEGMAFANVDPARSLAALNEAVSLADGPAPVAPANPQQATNLAAAYIRIGDYYLAQEDGPANRDAPGQHPLEKAVAAYQVALAATPWNINALDSVGYALHRLGRLEDARAKFEFLSNLDDTLMVAHADLARTLRCLGVRRAADPTALAAAYDEQYLLVSLLTKSTDATTRDTISQWQYPVNGAVFDLHETPVKIAYATCAMALTGHLRGLSAQPALCQRALVKEGLTHYQAKTVHDFLGIELDELATFGGWDPAFVKRARAFRSAIEAGQPPRSRS